MKRLAIALNTGNMGPKERMLMLVHNDVAKEKTGKEILTSVDKHSLSAGWKPKNNSEVQEYNRYLEGWKIAGHAEITAQTMYLNAQVAMLRAHRIVDHAMFADSTGTCGNPLELYAHMDTTVHTSEVLELVLKNSGLNLDDVIYHHAFGSVSEEVQRDILILNPDAKTERQYLDQEEIIADLFNGKDKLTPEAKEKIADVILDSLRNKYADAFEKKGLERNEWWFEGYYGDMPTIEIVKKWADDSGIAYDTESEALKVELAKTMHAYTEEHNRGVGELLKATILRWLDEGLFVDDYAPIWNSVLKNTCNDADTTLVHREVFKEWIVAKVASKALLQKLIDQGELNVAHRTKEIFGVKETVKILTGESLYNLHGEYAFAEDFKKQVDDLKPFGWLILFLREQSFLKEYATLLSFRDIFKRLSATYEIDVGYRILGFITEFENDIEQFNTELRHVADKVVEASYLTRDVTCPIVFFIDDMLIRLDEVKPEGGEMGTHFVDKLTSSLGDDF